MESKKRALIEAESFEISAKRTKSTDELKELNVVELSKRVNDEFKDVMKWVAGLIVENCSYDMTNNGLEFYHKNKKYIDHILFEKEIQILLELETLHTFAEDIECCKCKDDSDISYCCLATAAVVKNRPFAFKILRQTLLLDIGPEYKVNTNSMDIDIFLKLSLYKSPQVMTVILQQPNPFFLYHILVIDPFDIFEEYESDITEYVHKTIKSAKHEHQLYLNMILSLPIKF